MPKSVSEYLGVKRSDFEQTGAFDAILDVDSRLFIDPYLLDSTSAPELGSAYSKLTGHFEDVIRVLHFSRTPNDTYMRSARNLLTFGEVNGLCIGYSSKSDGGSGIGPKLRDRLLCTAKDIIDAGITDPRIFELMSLIEPDIGADRISDMVANIIMHDLLAYTERVVGGLGAKTIVHDLRGRTYRLPRNSYNDWPIILVPMDVLRHLPTAKDWSDIDRVASVNAETRRKINELIGTTWKRTTLVPKSALRSLLIRRPDAMRSLLKAYNEKPVGRYDFEGDPAGQVAWYRATRDATEENPLPLDLSVAPTPDEVLELVVTIGDKFKDLVENNKLSRLLYDGGKPKHEEAAQLIFYGVADSYCEANDLDLTRESNGGRGPVDFKVSRGYKGRVVVETKLSTNQNLVHGFEKQIGEYQKAEKTDHAVYVVIDVGGPPQRLKDLREFVEESKKQSKRVPTVIYVDAKPKASASKYS